MMHGRIRRQSYVVSAGNLDAIDFIAAAILSKLGYDVEVVIDLTRRPSSKASLRNFDPICAVPIPFRYAVSPDGSVRQLVAPAEDFFREGGSFSEPDIALLGAHAVRCEGNLGALLLRAREHQIADGLGSAASFMKACYSALDCPGVIVRERLSRYLNKAAIDALGERFDWLLSKRSPSLELVFNQGSYVATDRQTFPRFVRDGTRVLGIGNDGIPVPWSDIASSKYVELGGPLDAVSFVSSSDIVMGHIPYFTEMTRGLDADISVPAVEIVRSLFLKYPASRGWKFSSEASGVMVSDYILSEELGAYCEGPSNLSDWFASTVAAMADLGMPCDERWASSQSSIGQLSHELRKTKALQSMSGPIGHILRQARLTDEIGKKFYTEPSQHTENAINTLHEAFASSLGQAMQLVGRFGIPLAFRPQRSYSLIDIERRYAASVAGSMDAKKRISDIRFLAWELVRTTLAAVALFADTSWRASLPWLALFAGPERVAMFVKANERVLRARCESIYGFRVI